MRSPQARGSAERAIGMPVSAVRRETPPAAMPTGAPQCGCRLAPGGETHVQRTMAQEAPGQPEAVAGNFDDGLRLRPVPVGAVAEAAGFSYLDVRLPHRPGRQGVFRTGLWLAPEAAERGAGPHLQPH